MIDVTYSISEAEYFDIRKTALRPFRYKVLRGRVVTGLLAVASILAVITLTQQTSQDFLFLVGIASPAWFLYCLLYVSFSKTSLRKAYRTAAHVLSNVHVQLDPSGYRFDIPETTHGFLYWPAFDGWKEGSTIFMVIRGDLTYPIPKSALSSDLIQELRALLSEQLGPAGGTRKR